MSLLRGGLGLESHETAGLCISGVLKGVVKHMFLFIVLAAVTRDAT